MCTATCVESALTDLKRIACGQTIVWAAKTLTSICFLCSTSGSWLSYLDGPLWAQSTLCTAKLNIAFTRPFVFGAMLNGGTIFGPLAICWFASGTLCHLHGYVANSGSFTAWVRLHRNASVGWHVWTLKMLKISPLWRLNSSALKAISAQASLS